MFRFIRRYSKHVLRVLAIPIDRKINEIDKQAYRLILELDIAWADQPQANYNKLNKIAISCIGGYSSLWFSLNLLFSVYSPSFISSFKVSNIKKMMFVDSSDIHSYIVQPTKPDD